MAITEHANEASKAQRLQAGTANCTLPSPYHIIRIPCHHHWSVHSRKKTERIHRDTRMWTAQSQPRDQPLAQRTTASAPANPKTPSDGGGISLSEPSPRPLYHKRGVRGHGQEVKAHWPWVLTVRPLRGLPAQAHTTQPSQRGQFRRRKRSQ